MFHRSQIEKLEAEQDELKKDLKLIESSSNQAKNDKACENLGELGRKKRMSPTFLSCTAVFTSRRVFIRLAASVRPSVCLSRPHTHQGAACDAASVDFSPTMRTDILVIIEL